MERLQDYQKEDAKLVPDDVIAGILGFVGSPEETTYLEGNPRVIHETVLSLREKYPVLQVFAFSKGDIYPFSRHLERILSRLEVARLLKMDNPDFRRYIVRRKAKQVIRKRIHTRFNGKGLSELQGIAKEFESRCLAPSQKE